jgi:WhiB family transcriptional regulator, redox-sensing transcriptional regulator
LPKCAFSVPGGPTGTRRNPHGVQIRTFCQKFRSERRAHPLAAKEEAVAPVAEHLYDDWTWGWQFDGACRGADSSLFFAPNYFEKRREKDERESRAKAICAGCDVRDECLEYALRIRETHGIWGGLNEFERRQLLRRRALQAG